MVLRRGRRSRSDACARTGQHLLIAIPRLVRAVAPDCALAIAAFRLETVVAFNATVLPLKAYARRCQPLLQTQVRTGTRVAIEVILRAGVPGNRPE